MNKTLIIIFSCVLVFGLGVNTAQAQDFSGKILLNTEKQGEAWYVYPETNRRYFLSRPQDAFRIMRNLSLGVKSELLEETEIFPDRFSGRILLDVENEGRAYYINPDNNQKYFLSRPQDAFKVMKEQSLGVKTQDLSSIELPLLDVPFNSQAPFGNWSNPKLQDGCEEASVLMAMNWIQGNNSTKSEAKQSILDMSNFQENSYGEFRDASLSHIKTRLFEEYYNYSQVEVKKNIEISDIRQEISLGSLVLVPTNGKILHNPYFVPPGPSRHMLVIRGYDTSTQEFIVNDPGTKRGESFRYHKDNLFEAIRAYPTGYKEPIEEIKKSYLVVEK